MAWFSFFVQWLINLHGLSNAKVILGDEWLWSGPILITVLDVTLVPWLPHAFSASYFINSFSSHAMFGRSTERDETISSELLGGRLEQVAQVLETQSQEKLCQQMLSIY